MLRFIGQPFRMLNRLLHAVAQAHPAVYSFSPGATVVGRDHNRTPVG
jgi:hypothetical protein